MASNKSRAFFSNSGWMMAQQIYSMLLSLVVGALSARYLGPSNYGLINYGASIISFFTIISRLGMDSVIINEMLKAPEKQGTYLGSALVLRLLTSIASVFMVMGIIRVIEPGNIELYIVTLLQSIAIIMQTYEVLTYWFQMELKMKFVSIATMIALTVVAVWRVSLLAAKASVYYFAFSYSIQYFVCGAVVLFFFQIERNKNIKLKFNCLDGKCLLLNSYHFIISGIAVTFYMQIDKIMIGKMMDHTSVGIYTAATTVAALWEFVPTALINSAGPIIMKKRQKDYDGYIRLFEELLLAVTILFVVVSIAMMLLGKIAVLILYGKKYLDAVYPLSILIWSTGFAIIGTARGIWIVAEGYNKYTKYMVFVGAGVNLVLNFFFIQWWGIVGAAVTTLISQIVVSLIAPLFWKKTRGFVKIYFESFKRFPDFVDTIKRAISR